MPEHTPSSLEGHDAQLCLPREFSEASLAWGALSASLPPSASAAPACSLVRALGKGPCLTVTELCPENQLPSPAFSPARDLPTSLQPCSGALWPCEASPSLYCEEHSHCLEVKTEPLEGNKRFQALGRSSPHPCGPRGLAELESHLTLVLGLVLSAPSRCLLSK